MVKLSLDWKGHMKFASSHGSPAIELHSSTPGVSSPPQALAYSVMAKGRHKLTAMTVKFEGERAPEPPKRFVTMTLHFDITGEVPDKVVARAIDLSRDKYCSVWNTIRPDVKLTTDFKVHGRKT